MRLTVRILLLNYNGLPLLQKYLPSFERAAARSKHACAVGVVDNASKDGSVEWLRKHHPAVSVHALDRNLVLCAYNDVARTLSDDVLILMNNDIEADPGFVDPLVDPIAEHEDIFFVTPRVLSPEGRYEGNKTRAGVRFGVFWATSHYPGHEADIDRPGPTFQGGFGAFDRKKFVELDGYDDLYLPGRLEDADICFRAYQRGWRCLYAPGSVVRHEGGTSFHKEFGKGRTLAINWRNTFLFMWKNLDARTNFFECPLWLLPRLVRSLAGHPEFARGLAMALPQFSRARARRRVLAIRGELGRVPERLVFRESS